MPRPTLLLFLVSVYIAISVLSGTNNYVHLSEVDHANVKCFVYGLSIEVLAGHDVTAVTLQT